MSGCAGGGQGAKRYATGWGGADGCMRQTAREAKCNWLTRVAHACSAMCMCGLLVLVSTSCSDECHGPAPALTTIYPKID